MIGCFEHPLDDIKKQRRDYYCWINIAYVFNNSFFFRGRGPQVRTVRHNIKFVKQRQSELLRGLLARFLKFQTFHFIAFPETIVRIWGCKCGDYQAASRIKGALSWAVLINTAGSARKEAQLCYFYIGLRKLWNTFQRECMKPQGKNEGWIQGLDIYANRWRHILVPPVTRSLVIGLLERVQGSMCRWNLTNVSRGNRGFLYTQLLAEVGAPCSLKCQALFLPMSTQFHT